MDKNINNIIFGISKLTSKFVESENKADTSFEELAKFILSINETDKDTNLYFVIEKHNLDDLENQQDCKTQEENIRSFFKFYKIKLRENNIKFLIKKDNQDQVLDIDASIDDFVFVDNQINFSNDNTAVLFSDASFGEVAFLDNYFCIALYSDLIEESIDLKELQKISNKQINLNQEEITIDSLKYDFLNYEESKGN